MKSLINYFCIGLLAILMAGCNGEDESPKDQIDYFMTFKVNGEMIEYSGSNIGGLAGGQTENNDEFLFILLAGNERNSSSLSINFYQESPHISIGNLYHFDYQEEVKKIGEDNVLSWAMDTSVRNILTMYIDREDQSFVVAPIGNYDFYQINTYYSLNFTAISATVVEGTFTGKFCRLNMEGCVTITEGKFRLSNINVEN